MNRIEEVREIVDEILLKMTKDEARRHAYLHLYGVSQACALIAAKRKENIELSVIAGMLHDIYTYANLDSQSHAHKGAEMARGILKSLSVFDNDEINLICAAIYNHSHKSAVHGPLDEILKDADVMQHILYNPLLDIKQHEQKRFDLLKIEFGLEG
ncbi:MAG: HD domain-containing protein [Ruminococcaceae bacterium]|nr:HD domain-containing protein [Oscillospiraceae bacterium]